MNDWFNKMFVEEAKKALNRHSGSGGGGGGLPDEAEQLAMLIEADMIPAVHDASGAVMTDENGNIILRY